MDNESNYYASVGEGAAGGPGGGRDRGGGGASHRNNIHGRQQLTAENDRDVNSGRGGRGGSGNYFNHRSHRGGGGGGGYSQSQTQHYRQGQGYRGRLERDDVTENNEGGGGRNNQRWRGGRGGGGTGNGPTDYYRNQQRHHNSHRRHEMGAQEDFSRFSSNTNNNHANQQRGGVYPLAEQEAHHHMEQNNSGYGRRGQSQSTSGRRGGAGDRDHYRRDRRGGNHSNHKPFAGGEVEEEKGDQVSSTPPSDLNPDAPSFQPGSNNNSGSSSGPASRSYEEKPNRSRAKNQREALIEQLTKNNHECMVCCDKVRYSQQIWSCSRCYNIFHLSCIRKWVDKSDDETGWRCPSCQSCYSSGPDGYYCFCGKRKNPKASRYEIPHSCGKNCGKAKPGGAHCEHFCVCLCHPGPCPPCQNQEVRHCGCGKISAIVLCSSKAIISCEETCPKTLNCGVHQCPKICHQGECEPCEKKVIHNCHCGKSSKEVPCTPSSNQTKFYSCSNPCSKPLSCGNHRCSNDCHSGSCGPCKTSPEVVISCPCGQTSISEACILAKIRKRKTCTDSIPTCGKKCLKILPCGGGVDGDVSTKHRCQDLCHLSKVCPPCKLVSNVKCRCGSKAVEIKCKELSAGSEVTCQKKCNKKRSCGKHKCNITCCIDVDHVCPIVCQRPLRCGNHKCSRLCHALNPCSPCDIVSFDELTCECGTSVIYPPIPCGTRRPACPLPCSREHICDHPVLHPCHSEPTCPPCTVLTEKWCHGGHELRKNIMCHITHVSCGLPCKKMLSCGRHPCPKTCHAGRCLEDMEICKLACIKSRDSCGHACGAPCHGGECPESKCKVMTDVACPCGRRTDTLVCWKRENEYDRTVTWEYHKELKRLEEEAAKNKGSKVTDTRKQEIMQYFKQKIPKSAVMECDKECAKIERNRKLAEALQLENADVSPGTTLSFGTPNYSEFLTKFCKKNPQFVETIHKQITELVLKAKQSTKKNVTYGFNSMNRDKRHVVHEYSDHFGVLSESFDEEPNRNVVCFASKEKSFLPTVSLIDAVFRPTVRSERLKPNDDVTFRPEKRAQIQGPFNSSWNMHKPSTSSPLSSSSTSSQPTMVTLNIPGSSTAASSADFPPL